MERARVGELEELVLLAVGSLMEDGYAVSILKVIVEHTQRRLDVTAIHAVLRRLEKKGYVTSKMGGATATRGGRRKKYFTLSSAGRAVLDDINLVRNTLYDQLPRLTFTLSLS